ncbi:MAG TPA: glycoside hydrolase family 99-like domain-containing protein [Ramlibacter sp.]|uniref:glycosyltransferase WbsX family protein n=1 Tax=Ramlibacter sp. TaxID=1917967 RepID=UPI002CEDAF6D|nr:glycoside hydrolase family 99-like domain-containing protein [Ramlibacter sp.]HVZ46295.1 glycoside hydrolase family 99-like domain-containing protein [Ramlibacter sp.]
MEIQLDGGLAGAASPFDLLERLQHGRSQWHVEAPASLEPWNVPERIEVAAFYLPQFHRIDVNDRAWGAGSTDWSNVTRTQPRFLGHLQPHLPADLGFYDLTNDDVLPRQVELARHYGVSHFCYYWYWFGGTKVLHRPVESLLRHTGIPIRFCLCWANENWSRRWDGNDQEVILAQPHDPAVDARLIHDVLPFLADARYTRIDGAAVFVIIRPDLIGNGLPRVLDSWRESALKAGVGELLLLSTNHVRFRDFAATGLDGIVEFPPHEHWHTGLRATPNELFFDKGFQGHIADYDDAVRRFTGEPPDAIPRIPGVFPAWDNTARRRSQAFVFVNSTPAKYEDWLTRAILRSDRAGKFRRFVFVNAWNEWAEGAHLEPCRWYGHAHLKATRDAIVAAAARLREAGSATPVTASPNSRAAGPPAQ